MGPIVAGAEYRVSVTAVFCSQPDRQREVLRTMTGANEVTLSLPPSVGDERYFFWIAAWRDGRLVGDLYTHDAGVHSWNYRFQVLDASLPRWVYVAGAVVMLLLIIGAVRILPAAPLTRRRRLARRALVLTIVGVLAGGAYYVVRDRVEEGERRRAEEERAQSEAEGQARQRELIAAFVSVAPRPAWWAWCRLRIAWRTWATCAAWQGFPAATTAWASGNSSRRPTRASWTSRTTSISWRRRRPALLGRGRLPAPPGARPVGLGALLPAPAARRQLRQLHAGGTGRRG